MLLLLLFHQVSGIGARELWGTLRHNSQSKLEQQDDMIPPDVKVTQLLDVIHHSIHSMQVDCLMEVHLRVMSRLEGSYEIY